MSRWDANAVDRYEEWFETPTGAFALARERQLIERLVSAWPRRGQRLLDVGCGHGIFLSLFWEMGFDVSGLDASPDMLGAARKRLGPHAAYHVGRAEHLPFDDDEFDYVSLLTVLEFCEDPLEALREARRVAKYGILVAFLNRFSLYYTTHGANWPWKNNGALIEAHWFTCRDIRKLLLDATGFKPHACGSVLPGPVSTWRDIPPLAWLNRLVLPLGLGAYGAIRIDFAGTKPLTPLYSFTKQPT